ncbi:MAG TPA: zinc ribbon domain-containing protein [Thermoplasmata archaeon]
MRCPKCGTEMLATSIACPACGARFGRKIAAPPEDEPRAAAVQYRTPERLAGPVSKPSSMSLPKLLMTIILIVVVVVLPLAYNLGLFDPKQPEPEPEANLGGFFQWEAMGDFFGGEGGSVWITGDISNSGDVAGSGTVHIRVFDGYEWKDYYQGTGVVPVDGTVDFEYSVSCDRIIVSSVEVTITIQET